jgi:riboflavin kinase/FMN adenylyltransferase
LLPHKKLPIDGVFAVSAEITGRRVYGVANLGSKPTVRDSRLWLETHFFDFDGQLYGERLNIALHQRLRAIQTFDNLDALKTQIQRDIQAAKACFTTNGK